MKALLLILSIVNFYSVFSQEEEQFLNSVLSDFKRKDCDSFLMLERKDYFEIDDYNRSELEKVIPKREANELIEIITAVDFNRKISISKPWNSLLISKSIPLSSEEVNVTSRNILDDYSNARKQFLVQNHLDTITSWQLLDSLEDQLIKQGRNSLDYITIPECYRYILRFSVPVFTSDGKYAIIAFIDYVSSLDASGYIAVYKRKRKGWKQISKVCHWTS